jgi:hypothetical protein
VEDFHEIMGDFYGRDKKQGPHKLTVLIHVDDEPGFESYISGNSQEDGTYADIETIKAYYAHMAIKCSALPANAFSQRRSL